MSQYVNAMNWDIDAPVAIQTLFISRSSIIHSKSGTPAIIKDVADIELLPEFLEAAPRLAGRFHFIIVLTTYGGNRDDLPTEKEQREIDNHIKTIVEDAGGRIDGFYSDWSQQSNDDSIVSCPLLPLKVRRDFPAIQFANSILAGNEPSDWMLAFNCGMEYYNLSPLDEGADENAPLKPWVLDSELERLHNELSSALETINKIKNSAARIRGIRLAARCCCHAAATGKSIYVVCDKDSGMDTENFVRNLNLYNRSKRKAAHVKMLTLKAEKSIAEQLAEQGEKGDVTIGISAGGNAPYMLEAMEKAREMDILSISITGGKPCGMDNSDVVIKVPSTYISQVHSGFIMIISMIHELVNFEEKENRFF